MMTLGALEAILDDPTWTALLRSPLAVIARSVNDLGMAAARRFLAWIGGDQCPLQVSVFDATFIVRGSTPPPPSG